MLAVTDGVSEAFFRSLLCLSRDSGAFQEVEYKTRCAGSTQEERAISGVGDHGSQVQAKHADHEPAWGADFHDVILRLLTKDRFGAPNSGPRNISAGNFDAR